MIYWLVADKKLDMPHMRQHPISQLIDLFWLLISESRWMILGIVGLSNESAKDMASNGL